MNTEWKPGWSQGPQPSEEGQSKNAAGEKSDADFHQKAFGTDPDQAHQDLEHLVQASVDTSEQQAEYFASIDPQIGIRAYQHLIRTNLQHSRVAYWEAKIQELQSTIK